MAKYYSFELNRYLPYFQLIKEYFGISYEQILGSMSILESDPDSEQYVYILEKISIPTLEELFITWHFNGSELIGRSQAVSLVYFVANLYYGDNYYRYERSKNSSQEEGIYKCYDNIRKEALKMYIKFSQYKKSKALIGYNLHLWEKNWKEQHADERAARRKEIMAELEEDFGEIKGENWKKIEERYSLLSDERLNDEMDTKMMAEEGWQELNKQYKAADNIHFRFGIEKGFTIPNGSAWLDALFYEHMFPIFLDDINSIAEAKKAVRKDPGKDSEDPRLRAIVFGISRFFYDYKLVSSHAPSDLVNFLRNLLELMEITCRNGKKPENITIENLIENLPNAKTDPKFFTPEFSDIKDLSQLTLLNDFDKSKEAYNWLFTPDPKALEFIKKSKPADITLTDTPESPTS